MRRHSSSHAAPRTLSLADIVERMNGMMKQNRNKPTRLMRVTFAVALAGMLGCADEPTPVFVVEGNGALEGLVFLDADVNGRFDPSAGDVPLPNVRVSLR